MHEVVIAGAVRTPLGRRNGVLSGVHPVDLAAHTLRSLADRTRLDVAQVEYLIMGCVGQVGEQSANVGRNAVLAAGWPMEIPASSVDQQCSSSQQAVHLAAGLVGSGAMDVVVAAGVEAMTRVPMGINMTQGPGFPFTSSMTDRYVLTSQGISAEKIAKKWGITRQDADRFALESQMRASRARAEGKFLPEITPVKVALEGVETVIDYDEGIRPNTTIEVLGTLKPSFQEDGTHTAGNSSQITDGSAAVLLTTPEKARELGLKPRARIVDQVVVGTDPELMLSGPIFATRKIMKRTGMTLNQMDLVEINEAFAAVVLAWQKELDPDMSKVNVNGGAIALGHPLGATGARLFVTLLHELERRNGRYGLVTMCVGGGIGTATIIERLD